MGAKKQSTVEQEAREIEWIRTHPETALAYVREREQLRKDLERETRVRREMGKNLDRDHSLFEALNTRVKELEAENAELQSRLDYYDEKLSSLTL